MVYNQDGRVTIALPDIPQPTLLTEMNPQPLPPITESRESISICPAMSRKQKSRLQTIGMLL